MTISVSAYARHRSVSRRTVYNWINAGKIQQDSDGKIDANVADDALESNNLGPEVAAPPQATGYAAAREEHERTKAALAQLKLEKAQGQLVNSERVKAAWFEVTRVVRDRLLRIPAGVCDELALMDDAEEIRLSLLEKLTDALEALADEVQGIA